MAAAAQLHTGAEADHSHAVAVFLAEEGHGAEFLGAGHSGGALLIEGEVAADQFVNPLFNSRYLLIGQLLEVGEVEAEALVGYVASLLLHV